MPKINKIGANNKKRGNRGFIKRSASPVKIAYYVQRMLEKNMETKKIILIISLQFGNDSIREFANKYRFCLYQDIRRIANLIHNIPKRNLDKAMDTVLHDLGQEYKAE